MIEFLTADEDHNAWLRWVTLQPVLRRIFGCSFLPDHDYGKGGKGWRDIWQDLLSLILIEPDGVRETLINNFAGVRIDGSNATIIGDKPGEFLADRNKITRVWMDHGVWPLMTLASYIDQSGDLDILLKKQTYFRDIQLSRTFEKDEHWNSRYGRKLKDKKGKVYRGTILEHLLVQQLVQFFNVGEHNITRLESADWNDGLDMGFERGESVAFCSCYGSNMFLLADLLEKLADKKNIKQIEIAKEVKLLLDSLTGFRVDHKNANARRNHLFKRYFPAVQPELSGVTVKVKVKDVVCDLRAKGKMIFDQIKRKERVRTGKQSWFNGYYDNKGKRVEGKKQNKVRMTLTGQVFPIMGGLADESDIKQTVRAVNMYLKDNKLGGYRLNSDFGIKHYLDLGRAFGFAFGTKENGAIFSHMVVMYAYALYKRGFAREGYNVIKSLYDLSADGAQSLIYPGLPEYFDPEGRGMYHFLTGSASWLVLTKLTQVFGVVGRYGDLVLNPKLVKEEFDRKGYARVNCYFASKRLNVIYHNPAKLDFGSYRVIDVAFNGKKIAFTECKQGVLIKRSLLGKGSRALEVSVKLGPH